MKKTILLSLATLISAAPAWAAEGAEAGAQAMTTTAGSIGEGAYYALGAAFAIGLAALGGALAQSKIGAAAMDGLARNPQASKTMFVPMIIGLVLIESLVIYALVVAVLLVTNL